MSLGVPKKVSIAAVSFAVGLRFKVLLYIFTLSFDFLTAKIQQLKQYLKKKLLTTTKSTNYFIREYQLTYCL